MFSNQPVLKNENCKLKLKYLQFPHNIDIKQKMIFLGGKYTFLLWKIWWKNNKNNTTW